MDYKRYCERCQHSESNLKEGIICGLTKAKPNFDDTCKDFILDEKRAQVVEKQKSTIYPASGGKRFANYLLDIIFFYIFAFIFGIILAFIGLGDLIEDANDLLLGIIIVLLYYVPLESIFGRTIAKFITRTKVVTVSGDKPSFGNILGRTLCRFIPFEAFSFLGGEAVGWHDSISKTRVIDV